MSGLTAIVSSRFWVCLRCIINDEYVIESGSIDLGTDNQLPTKEEILAGDLNEIIQEIVELLENAIFTSVNVMPLERTDEDGGQAEREQAVAIGSPGLYLDAIAGVRPATEPYAEDMRDTEKLYKLAEVKEIDARSIRISKCLRRKSNWSSISNC